MASNYWLKLYHEILDDPKMGRLRDNLWRRVIECFLIAGETQADGFLPPLADIAWRLRVNEEILESELGELANVGILERRDGLWYVTHFEERQSAMSASERAKRWREQQRKQDYYAEETEAERKQNDNRTNRSQKRIDKEEERDTDRAHTRDVVVSAYENAMGLLTPHISKELDSALEKYGSEWIIAAIDIAIGKNKRHWAYVEGVLKNWQEEGRHDEPPGRRDNGNDASTIWARDILPYRKGETAFRDLPESSQEIIRALGEDNVKAKATDDIRVAFYTHMKAVKS